MKVLLTGAGFLGSHLAHNLTKATNALKKC